MEWNETIKERRFVIVLIEKSHLLSLVHPVYSDMSGVFACVEIPQDSLLTDVQYDMDADCFMVKAYHPSFRSIPIGEFAPRVQTSLQWVSFKMEKVNDA